MGSSRLTQTKTHQMKLTIQEARLKGYEGDPCDDGDACKANDTCVDGACVGGLSRCSRTFMSCSQFSVLPVCYFSASNEVNCRQLELT